MSEPGSPDAAADRPPTGPSVEAQREAEQTIRSIRRLEESNDPPAPGASDSGE